MSAGYADQIYREIITKYPELKVALYTTSTTGEEKIKLKNVDACWTDLNVLIYSPTISAGVSYDKCHFDVMFGVICSRSCCARDYHQMLRRVRTIAVDDVLILNYSNFQIHDNIHYTTYEETKEHCLNIKDINIKREYERKGLTTTIKYVLDDYDEIYVFNKAEDINSRKDALLSILSMNETKGVTYEILEHRDEITNARNNTAHRMNWKVEELLEAKDISHEEAKELQMKYTG